ncbi:hypothetical protein N1851_003841 [Merluccius polli]|uniref:Uncharacterized protein n=1 Tax=Merluccius polli TaxID=89951 RepID=A0AA47N921_MERPO|nr:hypothetical protein N1851_003841 [Merluccius polli]
MVISTQKSRFLSSGKILQRFSFTHLNLQLQGKDKTICDMISAVKAFKAKLQFYLQQVKNKRLQHFPSVGKMLESHAGAVHVLDVHNYCCDLLSKLGQEFEDRFNDFDKLEPCVEFIANPLMEIDMGEIPEQKAELFSVNPVEMEVKNIQNHVQLKSEHSQHFWRLVDPEH